MVHLKKIQKNFAQHFCVELFIFLPGAVLPPKRAEHPLFFKKKSNLFNFSMYIEQLFDILSDSSIFTNINKLLISNKRDNISVH